MPRLAGLAIAFLGGEKGHIARLAESAGAEAERARAPGEERNLEARKAQS